ncbi:cellulase/endoglucanase [Chitinispirillum alkaliphilum]|nr:cellulase/endoglucanase [Chitinispirillum alkaliphilum]
MDNHHVIKILIRHGILTLALFAALGVSGFAEPLPRLSVSGDSIVDQTGKRVAFTGLHITNESWGYWQYPVSDSLNELGEHPFLPQKKFPSYSLQEIDFKNIEHLSPFLVRYELSYSVFEKDNPLREKNMEQFKSHIERFNSMGIYVVPVLHFGPGLNLSVAHYEDKKHGDKRVKTIFEDSTLFFKHRDWWIYVANELKGISGIAGYQIYVEPRVPSAAEGGYDVFVKRTKELVAAIRALDPHRIIIVHTAFSREANPGERYWSPTLKRMVTDTGEQGIIWSASSDFRRDGVEFFYKIDDPNIVYAFSAYVPYDFCSEGARPRGKDGYSGEFFKSAMREFIAPRIDFGKKHGVPVIVDEFGVNHQQPRFDAQLWLKSVLAVFEEAQLPSWFYLYKGSANPWSGSVHNYGIYTYINLSPVEIQITDEGYHFPNFVSEPAQRTGFDTLFSTYFFSNSGMKTLSLTNNQDIKKILMNFFSRR